VSERATLLAFWYLSFIYSIYVSMICYRIREISLVDLLFYLGGGEKCTGMDGLPLVLMCVSADLNQVADKAACAPKIAMFNRAGGACLFGLLAGWWCDFAFCAQGRTGACRLL